MDRCPPEIVMLGHRLADAVRDVVTDHFRGNGDYDLKSDKSPVTVADRAAETIIRNIIMGARPDDGIVGEEFDDHNASADWQWVIDPIDGTKGYSVGKATFGTLIAAMYKGEYIFGLCDQAITKDRWTGAKAHPTLWNGHRVTTRKPDMDALVVGCTNPLRFKNTDEWTRLSALHDQCAFMSCGGTCLSFCLLASGRFDIILETGQHLHDIAALIPIINGTGGWIGMADGSPYRPNDTGPILAVGDKSLVQFYKGL